MPPAPSISRPLFALAAGISFGFLNTRAAPANQSAPVRAYRVITVSLQARRPPAGNPFTDVRLSAIVTRPDGRKITVDGFYDGDGRGGRNGRVWKLRFCPNQPGPWQWTTQSNLPDLDHRTGRFQCLPAAGPGPLETSGRFFRRAGGSPVFLIGNFLDDSAPARLRYSHTLLSEKLSETEREAMIRRAADTLHVNKMNIYLANRGDYGGTLPTTPWLGNRDHNDKTRFDLKRWHMYERIVRRLAGLGIFAELWFFADDSGFGKLSTADRNRLIQYGMARLSAFPNTLFVLCLEWQEGWSPGQVAADIRFGRAHNPWKRLWSVHGVNGPFAFPERPWVDFKATQPGNAIAPVPCNAHTRYNAEVGEKPLLVEELGHSAPKTRSRVRANVWAAFCGGAAGVGTGADLPRLRRFMETCPVPFWRMLADNSFTDKGFALVEYGREIVVYVPEHAGTIHVLLAPGQWQGVWFNPREHAQPTQTPVFANGGARQALDPPDPGDWVLQLHNTRAPRPAPQTIPPLVQNGHFTWKGRAVLGWVQHNGWWRPGQRPNLARRSIGDPAGDVRPCRTEDLAQLTRSMLRFGYPAFEHNFGLWYDRRRDAHDTRVRHDPFVRPPFLEQPWARSGYGHANDGLSRYDLTRFNPWYFQRLKAFADLCDARGAILFYKFYMQHALLEQPAHYMDFPWAPANAIQKTGMPTTIPAANTFYDVTNPTRAHLHRLYIQYCLDRLGNNRNVVFFPAEEYTGGLGFARFLIDTVRDWERQTGKSVTLALGAPKDVLDAVLADPARAPAIDVLDLRYFWIRKDGSLFAPPGGRQTPGRDFENGFRAARETSPEMEYRKVLEYRRRFPGKAIVDALEADRVMTWAFFMAGGDLLVRGQIHYPHFADPPQYIQPEGTNLILPSHTFLRNHLSRAWLTMRPASLARADSGPAWCLADPGKTYLVYVPRGGAVHLDLSRDPNTFRLRHFDPSNGALSSARTIQGGRTVTTPLPPGRDGAIWLEADSPAKP